MSDDTPKWQEWLDEFYPITAVEAAKLGERAALEHSLLKWKGMRPVNLQARGIFRYGATLRAGHKSGQSLMRASHETCALCRIHLFTDFVTPKPESIPPDCTGCPLYKVRDAACDEVPPDASGLSPFTLFTLNGDPEPMIQLIEEALRRCPQV